MSVIPVKELNIVWRHSRKYVLMNAFPIVLSDFMNALHNSASYKHILFVLDFLFPCFFHIFPVSEEKQYGQLCHILGVKNYPCLSPIGKVQEGLSKFSSTFLYHRQRSSWYGKIFFWRNFVFSQCQKQAQLQLLLFPIWKMSWLSWPGIHWAYVLQEKCEY